MAVVTPKQKPLPSSISIYMDGGNVLGSVYGGSNQTGTVKESLVNINSSVPTVYGGNNEGGTTTTTNVNINVIISLFIFEILFCQNIFLKTYIHVIKILSITIQCMFLRTTLLFNLILFMV